MCSRNPKSLSDCAQLLLEKLSVKNHVWNHKINNHFGDFVYSMNWVTAPKYERVRSSCQWLNCTLCHTKQHCHRHVWLILRIWGCGRSKSCKNSKLLIFSVIIGVQKNDKFYGFLWISHHKQKNKGFAANWRRITPCLICISNWRPVSKIYTIFS